MKKQRYVYFFTLFIYVLFPCFLTAGEGQEAARQTIEAFSKAEFEGDQFDKRTTLVKFSPERAAKEKERDPLLHGRVIFWDVGPLFVVDAYKVLDIVVKKDRAVATVSYKRVARSEGKSKIIPDYKDPDIVSLDLVHDGKQWWILDPPLPRISRNILTEIYRNTLNSMGDKWLERPDISEGQKQFYRERKEALRVLRNLP